MRLVVLKRIWAHKGWGVVGMECKSKRGTVGGRRLGCHELRVASWYAAETG